MPCLPWVSIVWAPIQQDRTCIDLSGQALTGSVPESYLTKQRLPKLRECYLQGNSLSGARACLCASVRVCECASVRACERARVRECECAERFRDLGREGWLKGKGWGGWGFRPVLRTSSFAFLLFVEIQHKNTHLLARSHERTHIQES